MRHEISRQPAVVSRVILLLRNLSAVAPPQSMRIPTIFVRPSSCRIVGMGNTWYLMLPRQKLLLAVSEAAPSRP